MWRVFHESIYFWDKFIFILPLFANCKSSKWKFSCLIHFPLLFYSSQARANPSQDIDKMAVSCLFHISRLLLPLSPRNCNRRQNMSTNMHQSIFLTEKIDKTFSPIIEIVKGALFSRICCRIFLFSSPKKERVPKCCPLRKTSRMFVCSPRSPRKVSQVLNSFLISCQLFLSICCAYNNTQG